MASTGSNQSPGGADLREAVRQRVEGLHTIDPGNLAPVLLVDLDTASASGLDLNISVAAARCQVPRIVRISGISQTMRLDLSNQHIAGRVLGFLGEPRVNVLVLNLALDEVNVE